MSDTQRSGISLMEVVVTLTVLAVLVALLLPAIQAARESARRSECSARLSQLGKAMHSFETTKRRLPNYDEKVDERWRSDESSHVPLLPWLDQAALYEQIVPPSFVILERGSVANAKRQVPVAAKIPVFRCPSETGPGLNNYCYNQGSLIALGFDATESDSARLFGPFSFHVNSVRRLSEITDGLSHTAAASERLSGSYDLSRFDRRRDVWFSGLEQATRHQEPGREAADRMMNLCRNANPVAGHFSVYSGETWAFSSYEGAWYNHVAGPNSDVPYCTTLYPDDTRLPSRMAKRGVFAASSLHPGSVNVLLADGSVRSVSNAIDGTAWRAFGTARGSEIVSDF